MKKFMALVMAAGLMTAMVGNAYAADVGTPYAFEFRAQCKDSSTYTDAKDAYQKNVNNSSIYVKHWGLGGSDRYTNHFRGRKIASDGADRVNCGAKWCTVNMNVPIQSNSITYGKVAKYSVSGRGNTNHYDYDGVSSVDLHGYMYL